MNAPAAAARKCPQCVVNFAASETCRRCRSALGGAEAKVPEARPEPVETRSVGRRLLWLAGVIVALIFIWSRSLLLTSDPIGGTQSQVVIQAIRVLEQAGFSREVVMLRSFANFRASDNWWNRYLGHRDAYAATNFPLGVVTLYPAFFTVPSDDTERAVILLHEAQHLLGAGEDAALERVWREKPRLGWTGDAYARTKVWANTKEWTAANVPALFTCGPNRSADCVP
jgi:hypothetical protein